MSVITQVQTPTDRRSPGLEVSQSRVIRSELTKFRSLRSTMWTLLISVVLTVGIGALFSAVSNSQFATLSTSDRFTFSAISTSLSGTGFAQLAVGVLGVLLISGEYSTGMIRSSLTAVPRRLPVLWGKLTVFAGAAFITMLVAAFAAFFLGQALLSTHGVSLSAPDALRSVIGAALYVTVAGMIGLALGALLRNTAAGISIMAAVFFVIPPLTQLLPASWTDHFVQYLPSNAGAALYGGADNVTNALSPWAGFAVLCGYAVVLIGLSAWSMSRRDA